MDLQQLIKRHIKQEFATSKDDSKGETVYNFRNYRVNNFNVEETGSAEQMYEKLDKRPKLIKRTEDEQSDEQPTI